MELAARCKGLVKRFEDVVAVNGLDLEIRRGECFGLLGPNGAGKTTTIEILEGLTRPDAGVVEVLGMAWGQGRDRQIRQRIGVQLQETQLGDKLTVEEVLTLFSSLYQQSRPIPQLLDWFELGPKAKTRFHKLSGGQKQRVTLACALVSNPDLLFLDEPTTGLDPQARRKVWNIVAEYQAEGGSVVLTSHYMEECEQLCDRISILDRGKKIALGTPDDLKAGLGVKQVVEFQLGPPNTPLPRSFTEALEPLLQARGEWWSLGSDDVSGCLGRLLELAKQEKLEFRALRTREPTLEDVFLELTGRSLRDD